jgi:hypothetical protein
LVGLFAMVFWMPQLIKVFPANTRIPQWDCSR